MDLKTHIKNHQILWGSGIGFVIFVSFIGGMILVNSKPWNNRESLSSNKPKQQNGESAGIEKRSQRSPISNEEPLVPRQSSLQGKITNINSETRTFTIKNSSSNNDSSAITIKVTSKTNIELMTYSSPTNQSLSEEQLIENSNVQPLSFEDLRKNDTITIRFSQSKDITDQPLIASQIRISTN